MVHLFCVFAIYPSNQGTGHGRVVRVFVCVLLSIDNKSVATIVDLLRVLAFNCVARYTE